MRPLVLFFLVIWRDEISFFQIGKQRVIGFVYGFPRFVCIVPMTHAVFDVAYEGFRC